MAERQQSIPLASVAGLNTEHSPRPNEKSLPRLPRGWSRVCHETSLFLRSIGLGIIASTFSGFRNNYTEPPKVAVARHRVTALLRSLIHIAPVGVALMEIIINWKGYYVGTDFGKQAYYQLAAKVHEVTIHASLATMVLAYIRHALMSDNGLPFGALLGGSQFIQFSYLWSTEFWSSVISKDVPLKRRLALLVVIVTCGLLAATVGPSSATLLIPRQVPWPLPTSRFSIGGNFQDVWPDRVDGVKVPGDCLILPLSNSSHRCPAGDWTEIRSMFSNTVLQGSWNRNSEDSGLIRVHDVNKEDHSRPIKFQVCQSSERDQICGSSPQLTVLEAAYGSNMDYEARSKWDWAFHGHGFRIKAGYYEPYSLTSCVSDAVTVSTEDEPLHFPRISETESELSRGRVMVPVPNYTKTHALQTSGNDSEFRLRWLKLPQDLFDERVIGAVLLHPQNSTSGVPLNITTCTLSAGWGTSAITRSAVIGAEDVYSSEMANTPKSWPVKNIEFMVDQLNSLPSYANLSGFSYPQRRIDISSDWAQFLNPLVIVTNEYNTTAINLMIELLPRPVGQLEIAHVLTVLLATGLARSGMGLDWREIGGDSAPCEGCLAFDVEHWTPGIAYTTQETTTRLAIAVMIIYCSLALAHIVYLTISGISSNAWDTTTEIVALAMNSSPTTHLQNTCAGIFSIKTFRTPVQILVTNKGRGKEEHLELVFGDVEAGDMAMSRLGMNEEYGTLKTD